MRVAVTRPEPDSSALAERLAASGYDVVVEPMLRISFNDEPLPVGPFQAVVASSANGIRALVRRDCAHLRQVPFYAVGPTTADAARDAGFETVISAEGDLTALIGVLVDELDPAEGEVLYVSGAQVSGDLKGQLEAEGFSVRRAVLYEATAAESLSLPLRLAIEEGTLDGVLLFSQRTARVWAELVEQAGLASQLSRVVHYCLSGAIGDLVRERFGFAGPRVVFPRSPDTDALLSLMES